MRFIHRVGLRLTPDQRQQLTALGVTVPDGIFTSETGDPLVAFDIDESDPNWPRLHELLNAWKVVDLVRTEFTDQEIDCARWLRFRADWCHGYPQPRENSSGYRDVTYDLSDWCSQCGIGKKQKASFQMKREPLWGKKSVMHLNWVSDQIFVTPFAWEAVFAKHGVACRPVTDRQGTELASVVQLDFSGEASVSVDSSIGQRCGRCDRVKYLREDRGLFPPFKKAPPAAIVRTSEYFGGGAHAMQPICISQALAKDVREQRLRGVSFTPMADR